MVVVDTNVIAALYLPSNYTAQAESLLLQDADWLAPALWRSEMRNVLTKYLRAKMMTLEQVCNIQNQAEKLMGVNEYPVRSADVLKLTCTSQCSAYDCEFVALAQHLNSPFVTLDKQILAQFPTITIALKDLEIKN